MKYGKFIFPFGAFSLWIESIRGFQKDHEAGLNHKVLQKPHFYEKWGFLIGEGYFNNLFRSDKSIFIFLSLSKDNKKTVKKKTPAHI